MNYEELYQSYQILEKELKEKMVGLQKLQKAIIKDMDAGDLKNFAKNIAAMCDTSVEQKRVLDELQHTIGSFDSDTYFENGEFVEQVLALCDENEIDVKGDFPTYEIFPYRVRFDAENQDIYVDRKKLQCMRPQSLVKKIKIGRDKLFRASFNATVFANELAAAYDTALLKQGKALDSDFYLVNLYKILTPMGRFRKDYDQQSYAFDLARLYISGITEIKDGRKFQFGPSRNNSKAIRILDGDGHEQFLATIRFYQ